MKCPQCESENTQRLELIYHSGTQDIKTTGTTVGGAHGGTFGIGGAVTKTSGQSQSLLAQKAAPPLKKRFKWAIILAVIGFILLDPPNSMTLHVAGVLLLAAGGYIGKQAFQFNSKEYPSLHQKWLDSWLCNKCGNIYHQAM